MQADSVQLPPYSGAVQSPLKKNCSVPYPGSGGEEGDGDGVSCAVVYVASSTTAVHTRLNERAGMAAGNQERLSRDAFAMWVPTNANRSPRDLVAPARTRYRARRCCMLILRGSTNTHVRVMCALHGKHRVCTQKKSSCLLSKFLRSVTGYGECNGTIIEWLSDRRV